MDAIYVKNLTYRYPTSEKDALKDVSFQVKKGEFCSIIGANGSGKTTLCNAIRGFVPKFYKGTMTGEVYVNGNNIEHQELGELACSVGFVFQNPFTQISGVAKTVYEELAFGLENMGVSPEEIKDRVEEVLKFTKTEEFRARNPYQLSGGQQQRIALASILIMNQEILVIDEPTSQLDPQSTDDIFEIIQLMKKMGRTIILVEHKMEQIAQYSDRIIVLDEGKIVLEGTPREVLTHEDCEKYKMRLPKCTTIGKQLQQRGIKLKNLPIILDEAVDEIKMYMGEGREVGCH